MKTKFEFNEKDYLKVIDYFVNNNDNRTNVIAEHIKMQPHKVNYYLDIYLSLKKNYMGKDVILPENFYN